MKDLLVKDWKCSKDGGILLLRIFAALILLYGHGFEKLGVIFSGQPIQFFDAIGIGADLSFYLAAFAEGICAILLIIGLFTRPAAIILTINFLVIVYFHAFVAKDGFPILETRFLYLLVFVVPILTGPGRISLDYKLFGEKK